MKDARGLVFSKITITSLTGKADCNIPFQRDRIFFNQDRIRTAAFNAVVECMTHHKGDSNASIRY
jgi:hypothetical protein